MFKLFYLGGIAPMTILTIILLALLLTAWKAPAWVKEMGIIALVGGVIFALIGFYIGATEIEAIGDGEISQSLVWGAMALTVITPIYGLLIYLVSLIIRIIQKPRI
ncbi:MAG: hypothetical protein LBU83_03830 [Bacteroidales bacterium]|jgi:hypothetical protein|nr:hypothetical protein [Bacteroidales bacterium]